MAVVVGLGLRIAVTVAGVVGLGVAVGAAVGVRVAADVGAPYQPGNEPIGAITHPPTAAREIWRTAAPCWIVRLGRRSQSMPPLLSYHAKGDRPGRYVARLGVP